LAANGQENVGFADIRSSHCVTLARAFAGITQKELASLMGRSQPFVARLEKSDFDVDEYVGQLVDAFRQRGVTFPPSFFRHTKYLAPESAVTFRKRSSCPAAVRDRAEFYAHVVPTLVAPLVERFVKYPVCDLPPMPVDWNSAVRDPRAIGAGAARALRAYWGLGWGPISDVMRLVESRGIRLFFVRERSQHLDGFAFWSNDIPFILLNSLQDDPARMRFDLAHELGHLVMHRELELDQRSRGHSLDLIESMAHGFAAEFLAPWEVLKNEVPSIVNLDKLGRLRSRWRISMQAIVKQMHANGALSDAAYTNAFRRFSSLGYRRGPEPVWIMPDTSVIHKKFLETLASRGLYVANLAEEVGLSERLLSDLIPQSTASTQMDFDSFRMS